MEAFSPEFADYWIAAQRDGATDAPAASRGDDQTAAQREALEALVERVVAARSIL